MIHRGTDPEAIKVAERVGLVFDGMLEDFYEFTVAKGREEAKGITFVVKDLSQVESRLAEKLKEFGIEAENPSRVHFDRASIDSAIAAAGRLKSDRNLYVFATHLGYTIDRRPPPGMQQYVIVHPDGTTETVKPIIGGNPTARAVIIGIGSSVCDKYTGTCGRITEILNDEVLIEPTRVKRKVDEYLEITGPPIRAKKINLEANHILRYEKTEKKGGNPMTPEEIDQVATKVAAKVLEETAPSVLDPAGRGLLLHFTEHEIEGAGLVVNEARARATPCNCFTYNAREYCFSKGIIGMMSSEENPEQIAEFCAVGKSYEVKPGIKERFERFAGAAEAAHKKIEGIPKGERLVPWFGAMSEELEKRGVEV